ncbi:MAG: class I SAM-dependent RNA methyltransferase [Acidimicrobiales bacterium]
MAGPESPTVSTTVRVKRPATGGAVGRLDDGRVVFVRHALPGELVRAVVTDRSRSFARADAVEVIEASPERVSAPCPYARPGGCGGCDLQHASEHAQLAWKAAVVAEHLRRIADVARDVTVAAAGVAAAGSRTRLRCAVTADGHLALRATRSHDLVALDACWIADSRLAPAFTTTWPGADEVELRAIGDEEVFAVARAARAGDDAVVVRALDGTPRPVGTRSEVAVGGQRFVVSPTSFWQSHRAAPATLLAVVTAMVDPQPGDSVVDLFSGVGLFAVPLAVAVGRKGRVTAVESSASATRDARENGEGLKNLTIREWSVSSRAVNDSVASRDVVVLDPPRQGLSRGVAPALVRRGPRRLVYVSCDAATFARDLRVFLGSGYTLRDLRVFDLFPMTEHVEVVGLLDRVSAGGESDREGADLGPRGG